MIPPSDLRHLARARLRDAKVLFRAGRYDAAEYISGYAVEMALKARICRTLRWQGFPESSKEFADYQSFRTHRLENLLHLSGQEDRVRSKYLGAWAQVAGWDPVQRYRAVGTATRATVKPMLDAVQLLVRIL